MAAPPRGFASAEAASSWGEADTPDQGGCFGWMGSAMGIAMGMGMGIGNQYIALRE